MLSKFEHRLNKPELMDDLSRPDSEFDQAYRELEVVNRRLGGIRAIERFLPPAKVAPNLLMLDVAAGGCDVGEALLQKRVARIVSLDINDKGFKYARKSWLLVGDAMDLPFADNTFDIVMASLFFHHLTDDACVRVLRNMWRVSKQLVIVNDLHRHPVAYFAIQALAARYSKSVMFRHDAPVSVLRAFRPAELRQFAEKAGVPARVHRSFPFRLVLVAQK
jgi:ubiquinone/menaquinone biosynthesis C-methylase UbiE